ncbi:MAG: 2,3-bisphosphoglycerate-independent phosphoglycerate mutase [Planctomycetota bacterium]|jgi:2,3-bisphosphoglycerate-independent phosphoglycerate mutase
MPSPPSARRPPVVLIVRDGWGLNPHPEHDAFNAVKLAATPVDDRLASDWPRTLISTCCENVGLPAGTMGNSEVGHQNIGAGRVVDQEIMRITRAIRDGSFFENSALLGAFDHAKRTGGAVHLLGLVSDGRVHSDLDHLLALIDLARKIDWPRGRLFVHAITDGRDTLPMGGLGYVERVESKLGQTGAGRIASVTGRYHAMDRDHRWGRTARAYAGLTGRVAVHPDLQDGVQLREAGGAVEAVRSYYDAPDDPSQLGDEFIPPTRIGEEGSIGDGDAVIFFNFRGDRPRQLTKAFILDDDAWAAVEDGGFDRGARLEDLYFCTMTGYENGLPVSAIAFEKPPRMTDILGQVVSDAGLAQLRCAETEKFAHVTFFFNDYREEPFPGEHRMLMPSPRDVGTYDLKPEMSAPAIRDAVLARLAANDCEALFIVNFANPDMVGHTGKLDATVAAVETVDQCVGAIIEATLARGGSLVITADHGNAEQMWDPVEDCPHTAHTVYDVPLSVVGESVRGRALRDGGRLADIAPTLLALMGLDVPRAMTGNSLLAPSAVVADQ